MNLSCQHVQQLLCKSNCRNSDEISSQPVLHLDVNLLPCQNGQKDGLEPDLLTDIGVPVVLLCGSTKHNCIHIR